MNFDNKQIEDFKKVIEDIVDAQIKKHRITTYVAAIVKDVHTIGQNTVDVVIPPDTTRIITGIQNKTGESLEIGDSVEICTKNGTLSNAWVSVKHGTSSSLGGGNYILDDLPIGAQFAYSSATNIPEGCLVCDGSAISRTDYSELFAVIGTTYGEGDGSTTFNLPNKRGRVSVGLDTTQTEFNSLGKHIGEKTHTLTIDEIPSHRHPYGDYFGIAGGTKFNVVAYNDVTSYPEGGTVATGGGQPHNNIQPSEVDIWLIKAKQKATNILPDAVIYNGLDSTSITDALSANMGKVLNDKIENNTSEINDLNEKINQDIGYQVGDIVVMPTNTSPASRLGGTWELIDKEFINFATNSNDNTYFTPSSSITFDAIFIMRTNHNLKLRLGFTTEVDLGDTTVQIGTINYNNLGIDNIYFGLYNLVGATDGGNGLIQMQLNYKTGVLTSVDVVPKGTATTISSGAYCYVLIDILLTKDFMLDEACDKFYWKKTA